MDNNSNNGAKPRAPYSESCNIKDSSIGDNPWPESRHAECSVERVSENKRELSHDKDNKVVREEQPFVYRMMSTVNTSWPVNLFENMAMNQHNVSQPPMPMPTGLDIVQSFNSNMNPYAFMGIPGENMCGVVGMGNYCQPTQENIFLPPVKEVVQLTNCVLYPPNAPRPTTRERPLGCKTVFVGGLPEKTTEEIIKEIFERCGTVEIIRMSKKNFCHIRFSEEMYVDMAVYFSGYRLKIENKDEAPYTGRLHVDYAQVRDDQHDYECKQRALQRQARHQGQDYYRPPTPPVVHYTDHEASLICEKLKNEETFTMSASILITWLEKGECTKKNASVFFSMVQITHNHVRKLQIDKVKYEEQLNEAKKMLKKQLEGIIRQFTEIEKIYKAATLQKCWDQFTKAQRKNIMMWKKQTEELKNAHLEKVMNEREDKEMELSDDENCDKTNTDIEQLRKQYQEDVHKYQKEADSLRCQFEAAQNEIMVMQSDHKEELKQKDDQMASMRQALQNSKEEMLNVIQKRAKERKQYQEDVHKYQEEADSLRCQLEAAQNEIMVMQSDHKEELKHKDDQMASMRQALQNSNKEKLNMSQKRAKDPSELKELRAFKRKMAEGNQDIDNDSAYENNYNLRYTTDVNMKKEVRLIAIISAFLHVHPFGANVDYICSYLRQFEPTVKSRNIENLLKSYSEMFREDSTGIGASLGKTWHFTGF